MVVRRRDTTEGREAASWWLDLAGGGPARGGGAGSGVLSSPGCCRAGRRTPAWFALAPASREGGAADLGGVRLIW